MKKLYILLFSLFALCLSIEAQTEKSSNTFVSQSALDTPEKHARLKQLVEQANEAIKAQPEIAGEIIMEKIILTDDAEKREYFMSFKLTKQKRSKYKDYQLDNWKDAMKTNLVATLKALKDSDETTKLCIDCGFTFVYSYWDKKDDWLFSFKITPDELK